MQKKKNLSIPCAANYENDIKTELWVEVKNKWNRTTLELTGKNLKTHLS